jgi:hypothetical protein
MRHGGACPEEVMRNGMKKIGEIKEIPLQADIYTAMSILSITPKTPGGSNSHALSPRPTSFYLSGSPS